MARVTVEDCIEKLPNRFELVMVAGQRARKISSGAPLTIERDDDKNPVVALRELADETISIDDLKEELITNYQRILPVDDNEESIDLMDGEEEWGSIAAKANEGDKAEGVYADEEVADDADDAATETADAADDAGEPSLEDMAGGA